MSSSSLEVKTRSRHTPRVPHRDDLLTIGELAGRTGLATSALRFYEDRDLIRSQRTDGGQRRFPREVVRRVSFIRAAQGVGLTLEEIGGALASLPDARTPTVADWARLSRSWRPVLDERIARLELLRDTLDGCIGCGCLSLPRLPRSTTRTTGPVPWAAAPATCSATRRPTCSPAATPERAHGTACDRRRDPRLTSHPESCQSGRMGRSRKPLRLHGLRGFESLTLRQERNPCPCRGSVRFGAVPDRAVTTGTGAGHRIAPGPTTQGRPGPGRRPTG